MEAIQHIWKEKHMDGVIVDDTPSTVKNGSLDEASAIESEAVIPTQEPSRIAGRAQQQKGSATRNAADYRVTIKISPAGVEELHNDGFHLYGFRAVQTQANASPLVWFRTATFSTSTNINWKRTFYAYTSTKDAIANGYVEASFRADINFNQTLVVNKPGNTGDVVNGGSSNAIWISNKLNKPFVGGIAERVTGDEYRPLCASKINGNNTQKIAPIEKVLLMFIQEPIETGTVVTQAFSPGVMIDLTAASQRQVEYDVDAGTWSWQNNEAWARTIADQADLVPLLIDKPSAFQKKNYYSEIG